MNPVVLHVDDRDDWRGIVLGLEKHGITVFSVDSLGGAMRIYKERKPDLVICDGSVSSPNDGLDWAKALFKQGQKVILLSTYTPPGLGFPALNKDVINLNGIHQVVLGILQ